MFIHFEHSRFKANLEGLKEAIISLDVSVLDTEVTSLLCTDLWWHELNA